MKLEVIRFSSDEETTLGLLADVSIPGKREFLSFTLEDQKQDTKVYAETRIPEGTYEIKLRKEGGFHERYKKRFPDFHNGMLHLQDVPNFKFVLIHIGNDDDDTAGCLLVGSDATGNVSREGKVLRSTEAYKKVYNHIATPLLAGEQVFITYRDFEKRP